MNSQSTLKDGIENQQYRQPQNGLPDGLQESHETAPLVDSTRIPLIEERLLVDKQVVETARIRLHKTVQQYTHQLDEPLAVRTFDIEHVVLNRPVEEVPGIRQEGDTTIYPVVEEQLILTKRLVLVEEVRVTRRDTERRDIREVVLTREHLAVEREPLA